MNIISDWTSFLSENELGCFCRVGENIEIRNSKTFLEEPDVTDLLNKPTHIVYAKEPSVVTKIERHEEQIFMNQILPKHWVKTTFITAPVIGWGKTKGAGSAT